jgi:putative ABC transport system permease protein
MRAIIDDMRYGLRLLRKSPAFTAVALLTLALGVGANTAIFTLLDQILFRSLHVKEANRLVLLRFSGIFSGYSSTRTDDHLYFSYPMYCDLRDHNSVFDGLIATDWTRVGVQWHNQPEVADTELVSGNYFDILGVHPAVGRLFVPSDDVAPEANPVAVISFIYWQRRFGADPHIVNQSISINGHPFTVIGVVEPGFYSLASGDSPAIFAPMMMKAQITPGWNDLDARRSQWLNIVGKLKPGLNREQAQAGIDPLWHSIRTEELAQRGDSSTRFRDDFLTNSHLFLDDGSKGIPVHGRFPTTLLVIAAIAGFIALMVCTNVASLLLVRVAGRTREISVRYALGAKRSRIVQQLTAEGILLGLAGGTLGLLLAPQASSLLIWAIWHDSSRALALRSHPDLRVLTFNVVLTLLATLLFSLAPALQFWRRDVTFALKQQVATIAGGSLRFRRVVVATQIGLSLLLLVGAGLFIRTLQKLRAVDVGFSTDHLVTFSVDLRMAGYQPGRTGDLYQSILDRLAGLPGVLSVAATTDPELANTNSSANITVDGYRPAENEDMNVEWEQVSPGYFSTLKMPVVAGRELTDQDRTGAQRVAVVNERFARRYFLQPQNALGHYFCPGAGNVKTDIQVVGVVRDTKHTGLREEVRRAVFTPYLQEDKRLAVSKGMTFYVRTWEDPKSAEPTIRQAMQVLDSQLVLYKLHTMQEQVEEELRGEQLVTFLASSFGVLAALMAAIGIYGVLAYSTAQRTREIGIRIAMGASRAVVVRMVLTDVLSLAGIGIAVGVPASLLWARAIRSQLFGITSYDPLTLIVVCVIVAAIAFASAAIPARRAAKVDPMVALRYE